MFRSKYYSYTRSWLFREKFFYHSYCKIFSFFVDCILFFTRDIGSIETFLRVFFFRWMYFYFRIFEKIDDSSSIFYEELISCFWIFEESLLLLFPDLERGSIFFYLKSFNEYMFYFLTRKFTIDRFLIHCEEPISLWIIMKFWT